MSDDEPVREAAAGDVVELTVTDLPGAGYRWETVELPEGLTELDSAWVQDEPPAGVGASRARVVRLRADVPGDYVVRLELRRPWEDPAGKAAQATEVRVSVRPAP